MIHDLRHLISRQIWNIAGALTRNHSAPFPLEFTSRLVRMFSFQNDTVLDPFCGTGTTMIAALKYGKNGISVDIEPDYCSIAAGFLKKEISNLFLKTDLIFEKLTTGDSGRMQVCEDQAIYNTKAARKSFA